MVNKIKGVKITNLKIIKDKRGSVLHMMKKDLKVYKKFGEIYFSTLNSGKKKGWNLHKKMTLNLTCIKGKIKIVLYDNRAKSKTYKIINSYYLSRKKYYLLTVPPNIWCGFKNLAKEESILANFSSMTHNPKEILRKPLNDKLFLYKW